MKYSITLIFTAFLVVACGQSAETAWEKTQAQDTIPAYNEFLRQHGASQWSQAARDRLHTLEEMAAWSKAQKDGTSDAFRSYLTSYPQGANAAKARKRLEALERQMAWREIADSSNTDELEGFIDAYPDTKEAAKASEKLAELMAETPMEEQPALPDEGAATGGAPTRATPAAEGDHAVQLAAFRSARQARASAERLQSAEPDLLGAFELHVIEPPPGSSLYRVRTAPMDRSAAVDLCLALKARQQDCIVVRR